MKLSLTRDAMVSVVALLIVFMYVFGWRVYGFIDLIQLISFPFAVYFYSRKEVWRHKAVLAVTAAFLVMSLYGVAAVIASGGRDPFILARVVRAWLTFGGALGITWFIYNRLRIQPSVLHKLLFLSISAHGAIMIAMYMFPAVRTIVYSATGGALYANAGTFLGLSLYDVGVRVMGLTYGLSSTSLVQMSGLLMASSFLLRGNFASFVVATTGAFLVVISSLLAGRSGVTIFAILAMPLVGVITFSRAYPWRAKAGFASMIGILTVILVAVWTTISVSGFGNWQLQYTVAHIRDVQSVFGSNSISKVLIDSWVLPSDALQLMFGAGTFGRIQSFYVPSDVGFVLQIYAYGIFGTILFWGPLLIMSVNAARQWRVVAPIVVVFLFTVLASIIFSGKEEALYERCFWSIQALLWSMIVLRPKPVTK